MELLITAIMAVESGGEKDPLRAVGRDGLSYGCMQITDICREDVNRIYGTTFEREDCFSEKVSRAIFEAYMNHYATPKRLGRAVTDQDRARIWNGGGRGWRKPCTEKYWIKVKKELDRIGS